MISIRQDFRFDNGYDSSTLADGSIASKDVGVLQDSQFARIVLRDLQHTPPLGELASILLILNATSLKIVETLGRAFVISAEKGNNTLVDFDAWQNITLLQKLDKWRSILGLLVQSFVEQDNAGDMLTDDILSNKRDCNK